MFPSSTRCVFYGSKWTSDVSYLTSLLSSSADSPTAQDRSPFLGTRVSAFKFT